VPHGEFLSQGGHDALIYLFLQKKKYRKLIFTNNEGEMGGYAALIHHNP